MISLNIVIGAGIALLLMLLLVRSQQACIEKENEDLHEENQWLWREIGRR